MPDMRRLALWGVRCCVCPVAAAKSRGLTCEPLGKLSCSCGIFAIVPVGVKMLDGISEVKTVAEEGEMRYFDCRILSSVSLKPICLLACVMQKSRRTTDLLIAICCRK
jgi:hypothetical protein